MPVAFVKTIVEATVDKTSNTSDQILTTAAGVAGNTIVAYIIFDNAAVASKPVVSSIGKPASETASWVFLGAARSTSTSAGAFSSGEIWAIKTTVAWSTQNLTITWDTTITMKSTSWYEFSGVEAIARSTAGAAYSTTTTAASATSAGTTPVIGDLVLGLIFQSNSVTLPATDTDTTGGAWLTPGTGAVGTTGGSNATNNFGRCLYKITTAASHQTLNSSAALTAGNGAIVAVLQAVLDPTITQASYRFYADGTESGSTALAAQDTAITADVTAGDVNVLLRTRLQSTTAVTVPSTDDWVLQYEKNASGTWSPVGGPNDVGSFASANLTTGEATTNQLGAGTGSFVAGKVSETGGVVDLGWTANNYTEVLYAITLKQANLFNADTLRFRVLRNGATTGLTYTQTPTINVTKTVVGGLPKVYLAGAFTEKPIKVWSGSAFVAKPMKYWSGSAWVLV